LRQPPTSSSCASPSHGRRRRGVPRRWSCTGSGAGKLVVDFSSIHPNAARSIAARLKDINEMGWIDAPVSGGTVGAKQGTLAIMAGGDTEDIENVRSYVLAMARRFTHMGPTAEATRLVVNSGIDATRLPEALAGGFADSIPLQLFVPRMARGIYSPPLGHIATMLKDLDTVVDVAGSTSSPVAMVALAAQLFRLASIRSRQRLRLCCDMPCAREYACMFIPHHLIASTCIAQKACTALQRRSFDTGLRFLRSRSRRSSRRNSARIFRVSVSIRCRSQRLNVLPLRRC
jgi:hypothetical protein